MSNVEKSFSARLSYDNYAVCFYELTLNAANVTGGFKGRTITVPGNSGFAELTDSKYLCLNDKLYPNEGDLLYFNYLDDGYHVHIMEGPNKGLSLGVSDGWLCASNKPVLLTLKSDHGDKLTLDDFRNESSTKLAIIGPRGSLQYYKFEKVDNSLSYSYIVTHGGTTEIPFLFTFVEKNGA